MLPDKYSRVDCPICGKSLAKSDVVVCPECGAPYHRECQQKEGVCIFPELHAKGEAWKPPFDIAQEMSAGREQMHCPRCGTENPPNGLFCQVCGTQLNSQEEKAEGVPESQTPPFIPFGGMYGGGEMPLNPFFNPFGGLSEKEEIDGVPVKDLAIFVGRNSHYFLPKFKALSKIKVKLINWSAFLFTGGYYLYRKMYGIGILIIIVNLLLSVPSFLTLYNSITEITNSGAALNLSVDSIAKASMICSMLAMVVRLVCGLFANSLYKSHVFKKISKIKAKGLASDEYYSEIAKSGSVAIKLISTLATIYLVATIISTYAIMFLMK